MKLLKHLFSGRLSYKGNKFKLSLVGEVQISLFKVGFSFSVPHGSESVGLLLCCYSTRTSLAILLGCSHLFCQGMNSTLTSAYLLYNCPCYFQVLAPCLLSWALGVIRYTILGE